MRRLQPLNSRFPLFLLLTILFSLKGLAVTETNISSEERLARIRQNNLSVGGNFSFTKNSGRANDGTELEVSFSAKYFLIDHLALGLAFGLDVANNVTVSSLGPIGSYFFWNEGKIAGRFDL